MKKKICLLLVLSILILSGCRNAGPAGEFRPEETNMPTTYQTDSANEETGPVFMDPELDSNQTESVSQTESGEEQKADPTTSTRENKPEGGKNENESGKNSDDQNKTSQTEPVKPTDPPVTDNDQTQSSETEPIQTQPKETEPPATESTKPEEESYPLRTEKTGLGTRYYRKNVSFTDSRKTWGDPPTVYGYGINSIYVSWHDKEGILKELYIEPMSGYAVRYRLMDDGTVTQQYNALPDNVDGNFSE